MFLLIEVTIFVVIEAIAIEQKINSVLIVISFTALCLYLYFRLFTKDYTYYGWVQIKEIKYADYFIVLFVGILITWIFNNFVRQYPIYKETPFLVDKPWQSGETDLFSRKRFADQLADKIQSKINFPKAGALAIGINAEWGAGKTSFINQVESSIDKTHRIVIHFNPWRSSSPTNIIEDFFELLIEEISPFAPEIKSSLTSYARTLTKINESAYSKLFEAVIGQFDSPASKSKKYEDINNHISKLNFQIIVFIDDLDRLDKKEILEVLRIIRNTANFHGLVYVVTYDKPYIEEAIKEFNHYNYRSFLEKIFQFEFALPRYNNDILRTSIKHGLRNRLTDANLQLIGKAINATAYRDEIITDFYIKTHRDVIRFINSFLFEYEMIDTEVQIMDFYFLQLIKIKYPLLHRDLYYQRNYIFYPNRGVIDLRTKGQELWNNFYTVQLQVLPAGNNVIEDNNKGLIIEGLLDSSNNYNVLTSIEKNIIVNTLKQLIIEKREDEIQRKAYPNSFRFEKNFERYFNYAVLSSDISTQAFELASNSNFDDYKTTVFKWIDEGRINQLEFLIYNIKDFASLKEWENQLKIVVAIASFFAETIGSQRNNYPTFFDIINYPINFPNTILFFKSKEEYKEYILNFFKLAESPYLFQSRLLALIKKRGYNIVLTNRDIIELLKQYFIDYCNTSDSVNPIFNELYKNAIEINEQAPSDLIDEVKLKKTYTDHLKKYLKANQLKDFVEVVDPENESFKLNDNLLRMVFENDVVFKDYLENSSNFDKSDKMYMEFMNFYKDFKASSKSAINFNFQHLYR